MYIWDMHMRYVSFKVTTWTSPSRPVVSSVWAPTCFRPVTCGPPRPPGMRPSWPRWRGETLGEWLVNDGWMVGDVFFWDLGILRKFKQIWEMAKCLTGQSLLNDLWKRWEWGFSCIPHTYRYWIFMIFHAHPLMATRSRIPMYPPWRSLRMALHRFCPRTSVRSGKTEGRTWFWG